VGETTKIAWSDHTFSPWLGCAPCSAGCNNCYAERWAKQSGRVAWGGPRILSADSTWRKVLCWYEDAKAHGSVERIFPSLCDPLDPEVPDEWRERFYGLIRGTHDHFDWLLLTKRSQLLEYVPPDVATVSWLGVSVESGAYAYRVADLNRAIAGYKFISVEPMIGSLDLSPYLRDDDYIDGIDHVIVGGESGPNARPLNLDWVRAVRDACAAADVPFMFKQGSGLRPEKFPLLDGVRHDAMPITRGGSR